MARALRIERPGGWDHHTAGGNEHRPIFRDARDRQRCCQLLAEMVSRFDLRLRGNEREQRGAKRPAVARPGFAFCGLAWGHAVKCSGGTKGKKYAILRD